MTDFKLQGEVVLDDNGFKSKLNDLKSEGEKFGSSFKNSMFGSMTAANLAAKGVELLMSTVRSAVNEFGLLDKNLAKVNTVINKQAGSITNLRMELLKISTETGIFASELANASYEALSAGVATETLGEFINQAAILSQAGFLSTTQAVSVLTSVMGAYGKEVLTVEQISNKLVTAQANGKFTIDDLAKSMSSVTPIAASLGVSLDEVLASISAITMTGASASEATTRLRAALSVLSSGSSNVSIAFKEMTGKTFADFIREGNSVGDAFQNIAQYSEATGISLTELTGSSEASLAILGALSEGGESYRKALVNIQKEQMKSSDVAKEANANSAKTWGDLAVKITNVFLTPGGVFSLINSGIVSLLGDLIDVFALVTNIITKITDGIAWASKAVLDLTKDGVDFVFGREKKVPDNNDSEVENAKKLAEEKRKTAEESAKALNAIKQKELEKTTIFKQTQLQSEIDFQKEYNSLKEKEIVTSAELNRKKVDFEAEQKQKSLDFDKEVIADKMKYYSTKEGFEKQKIELNNQLKAIELEEQRINTELIVAEQIVKNEKLKALSDLETDRLKKEAETKRIIEAENRLKEKEARELEIVDYQNHQIAVINTKKQFDSLQVQREVDFFNEITRLREEHNLSEDEAGLMLDEFKYAKFEEEQAFKLEQLEKEAAYYLQQEDGALEHARKMADIEEIKNQNTLAAIERQKQIQEKEAAQRKYMENLKENIARDGFKAMMTSNGNVLKAMKNFAIQSLAQIMLETGQELFIRGTKDVFMGKAKQALVVTQPHIAAEGVMQDLRGVQSIAAGLAMGAAGGALASSGSSGGSSSGGSSESGDTGYSEDINNREEAVSLEKEKSVTIYTDGDMKDVMLSMLGTLNDLSKDYNNIEIVSR